VNARSSVVEPAFQSYDAEQISLINSKVVTEAPAIIDQILGVDPAYDAFTVGSIFPVYLVSGGAPDYCIVQVVCEDSSIIQLEMKTNETHAWVVSSSETSTTMLASITQATNTFIEYADQCYLIASEDAAILIESDCSTIYLRFCAVNDYKTAVIYISMDCQEITRTL
jgi:hypothetical protein